MNKGLYVDDITRFLRQNTQPQPQTSGGPSYKQVEKKKPEPIKQASTSSIKFPKTSFLKYDSVNTEGPLKKIIEYNATLMSKDDQRALNSQQLELIKTFLKTLNNVQFYHTSTFTPAEVEIFTKMIGRWPLEFLIPYLDCFRIFVMHPRSNDMFQKIGRG